MDGKKVALFIIGLIVAASLFVVVVIQIFFMTYEPKEPKSISSKETGYVILQEDDILK